MNGANEKYLSFSVEDFVWDDAFRSWVMAADEETEKFWNKWLQEHPQKAKTVEIARQIILSLQVQTSSVDPSEIEFQFDQIIAKRDAGDIPAETARIHRFRPSVLAKIAAVFVLVAGIGLLFFLLRGKDRGLNTVATSSGVQKRVLLWDSSSVLLNSNSKISFAKKWGPSEVREIWMEGEGYFVVKHLDTDHRITNHERFLVHVNGVTVEVLGTTFNIRNRRSKTEIVLKEGSIRLSFDDHRKADILMTPAEIITIDGSGGPNSVSISKIKPDDYSSWIHQRLVLNNTYLNDIIQYLEDNYGKKIILSDSSLRNKRIDGTLMLDNLDDALFVLSKVLNARVQQNDTSIYFIKL